jgi:guanylate kinase
VIQRRLRDAAGDMGHWREFDFVVVNEDFETALAGLQAIVHGRGEASRRDRPGLAALAGELTSRESGS